MVSEIVGFDIDEEAFQQFGELPEFVILEWTEESRSFGEKSGEHLVGTTHSTRGQADENAARIRFDPVSHD